MIITGGTSGIGNYIQTNNNLSATIACIGKDCTRRDFLKYSIFCVKIDMPRRENKRGK